MIFGVSSMILRRLPVTEAIEGIYNAGFSAVEVWMEHFWQTNQNSAAVREKALNLGVKLSVHAASHDLNICSSNSGIRRESLNQVLISMEVAAEIGAKIVVVHPGSLSSYRAPAEYYWPRLFEAVSILDEKAGQLGLSVGIEGMEKKRKYFFVTVADIKRLFENSWRNVGLTVDIAHMPTVMDPVEYINSIPDGLIIHAHCSDHSVEHTHMPLGKGQLNLPQIFNTLKGKYDGTVILEGIDYSKGEDLLLSNAQYLKNLGYL